MDECWLTASIFNLHAGTHTCSRTHTHTAVRTATFRRMHWGRGREQKRRGAGKVAQAGGKRQANTFAGDLKFCHDYSEHVPWLHVPRPQCTVQRVAAASAFPPALPPCCPPASCWFTCGKQSHKYALMTSSQPHHQQQQRQQQLQLQLQPTRTQPYTLAYTLAHTHRAHLITFGWHCGTFEPKVAKVRHETQ